MHGIVAILIPHIGEAFVEQQRKHELLALAGIPLGQAAVWHQPIGSTRAPIGFAWLWLLSIAWPLANFDSQSQVDSMC